jgi:hypothetical protein
MSAPPLLIGFLAGFLGAIPPGLYVPSPAAGATLAIGVGAGVASYFTLLARAVGSAPRGRVAPWLRIVGGITGLGLVVAGSMGAAHALAG